MQNASQTICRKTRQAAFGAFRAAEKTPDKKNRIDI